MFTLYRTENCPSCTTLEETLDELVVQHEVVVVDDPRDERLPNGRKPPVLVDDERVVEGSEAIQEYLEGVQDFKAQWDKFQSDACYCDDEGDVE
jgi:glutaredoxin